MWPRFPPLVLCWLLIMNSKSHKKTFQSKPTVRFPTVWATWWTSLNMSRGGVQWNPTWTNVNMCGGGGFLQSQVAFEQVWTQPLGGYYCRMRSKLYKFEHHSLYCGDPHEQTQWQADRTENITFPSLYFVITIIDLDNSPFAGSVMPLFLDFRWTLTVT